MRSFHVQSLLSCVFLLSCSPSQAQLSSRHGVRHRHLRNFSSTLDAKYKRDANVAFTYFIDGVGSCGATNGPNDFIVALNSGEYDNGAHCFEMISITVGGKTAQAQITDECPTCSNGGLDLSQALFEYFAPLSVGEVYGSWSYNSGTTTSSSAPPPITTYTPTSTTTVAATTTSPSIASSTTSTAFSVTTVVSSSTPTTSVSAIPTSLPQDPQVIAQINFALLEVGLLLDPSLVL